LRRRAEEATDVVSTDFRRRVPGATVIERAWPGALTMALLARSVRRKAGLVRVPQDHRADAADNVGRFFGPAPQWTLKAGDVYEAIEETEVDRVILDLPNRGGCSMARRRASRREASWSATCPPFSR